jgi:DivIVA domain-containing protein
MVDFSSDAIVHRSFRTTLRGFDQSEVKAFLRETAEAVAALTAERDRLAAKLQAGDIDDLKQEIEAASQEILSVLEAARAAAESMRERAATEAARWRSDAAAEAERTRREAQADAEHMRTDAWTASEAMLSQVQHETDRVRSETEKEAMRLVGEAERNAHRTAGAGRREAEELIRTARMEAERLVLAAKASHDEIIALATRKAEVAQERTRALEERRDELRRELDSVRAAITAVESELDERREALSSVPVVPAGPENEAKEEWTLGETVRVVRPGQADTRSDELPVVSEPRHRPDPTPELRVLTAAELRSRQQAASPHTPDPAASADDDSSTSLGETGDVELDEDAAMGDGTVPEAVEAEATPTDVESEPSGTDAGSVPPHAEPEFSVDDEAATQQVDDIDGLFARLREPVGTGEQADSRAPVIEEVSGRRPEPRSPAVVSGSDPFEVRDELLLPVSNRALRNLKRQLTEEQNGALEAIRLDESGWRPDSETLEASLRPDLVVLAAESFAAGHAAAERLTGDKLPRPSTPTSNPTGEFVKTLSSELERAVSDGRSHGHGSRELGSDVSRIFRAWRTDETERRLRHYSYLAFNRGLVESLRAGDAAGLRWVVAGRGCAACRELGGRDSFEDPPPAHEGCGCTVVPA